MSAWDGFASLTFPGDRDLSVVADYGGSDDDPTPLACLRQPSYAKNGRYDLIELTEAELRWLVDEVAPVVLKRMGERP